MSLPSITIMPSPSSASSPTVKTITILPNEFGFVRLREAPSTESAEIGQLTVGGTYPYREKRYDWYLVEAEGKEGWISGTYVEEIKGG